ncbi:MAG: ABC transporter ATP-binding protein [Sphaerochaeta sp.]|jgi:iron(III) transport system ATP-binding protein|nr:ABC transporter ATP-binding protein [Sphaerochaeta sp.]MDX9914716.1 ABC transporter ATP-binding protein [Sphaerochaeta sp.]
MAEIHIRNLVKKFQGNVTAVDSLSLSIADGEFVSFLGPSGCGKTTTLRMLAGLEEPTSGEILLDDHVLFSSSTGEYTPPEKRGMGLVFQSYALWPHMTVWENIRFGLIQQKVPKEEQQERIKAVIKLLQIEGLEKRYSFQISGGQQQRVALARMLALRPNTLLLDEPLSNLDAQLRIEMRSELKRLHERLRNTTIFVTHDQLEAMTLSTRIAVMRDGKLQQYGTPMEIYRKPANLFVAKFVGSPPVNIITEELAPQLFASAQKHLGRRAAHARKIAFRPESMVINPPTDADDRRWHMKGSVAAILPTGPEWILQIESESVLLFARMDTEPKFSTGDNCTISIESEAMLMFDEAEARLD